jgi:putative membrane protein insertion efficiency factor
MTKTIPPDYEFPPDPQLHDLPLNIWTFARWPFLLLIRLYQMTLAKTIPDGTCRFYPTCSHYGYQAIYKHGVLKGIPLAVWRVLRCNPFNPGGFDPVP